MPIDSDVPVERPPRHIWVECVGAGRANEALRADWQEHFRAVSVLGTRYVRFHGHRHDVDRLDRLLEVTGGWPMRVERAAESSQSAKRRARLRQLSLMTAVACFEVLGVFDVEADGKYRLEPPLAKPWPQCA